MKQTISLTIIMLLATTSILIAQSSFNISPTSFEVKLNSDSTINNYFSLTSTMVNNSNVNLDMEWILSDIQGPEEWEIAVADNEIEYFSGVTSSPNPFLLESGDTSANFMVFISSLGVSGCGTFKLSYRDFNTQEIIQIVDYAVDIDNGNCFTTSTIRHAIPNLTLSPNPTSGILYFSFIDELENFKIHDTLGRLIRSVDYVSESRINISDLHQGLYIISAEDKYGRVSHFKIMKSQ